MIPGRSIPVWLAALALMLNTLGPAGMVLCIGVDGHMAFEASCFETPEEIDCCDPGHHGDEADALADDDHCGDCTDLPLLTNPLRPRPGDPGPPLETGTAWLATLSVESIAPAIPPLFAPCPGSPGLGPPGWLRDARTVVLRL